MSRPGNVAYSAINTGRLWPLDCATVILKRMLVKWPDLANYAFDFMYYAMLLVMM